MLVSKESASTPSKLVLTSTIRAFPVRCVAHTSTTLNMKRANSSTTSTPVVSNHASPSWSKTYPQTSLSAQTSLKNSSANCSTTSARSPLPSRQLYEVQVATAKPPWPRPFVMTHAFRMPLTTASCG